MTDEPLQIRPAHPVDTDALTRIAHAAKRHWRYPEQLIELWRRDLTVTADLIANHPVFCAVIAGQIVGFYALSREGDDFELEHMWVDPSRIGTGVGQRLFRHAVQTVRSAGGVRLEIASDPHAEGFYLRMGARRIGEEPSRPAGRMLPLLQLDIDVELEP